MKIKIISAIDYDEAMYDAAYGFAKKMIASGVRCSSISRRSGFVLTATFKPAKRVAIVNIHSEPPHGE